MSVLSLLSFVLAYFYSDTSAIDDPSSCTYNTPVHRTDIVPSSVPTPCNNRMLVAPTIPSVAFSLHFLYLVSPSPLTPLSVASVLVFVPLGSLSRSSQYCLRAVVVSVVVAVVVPPTLSALIPSLLPSVVLTLSLDPPSLDSRIVPSLQSPYPIHPRNISPSSLHPSLSAFVLTTSLPLLHTAIPYLSPVPTLPAVVPPVVRLRDL